MAPKAKRLSDLLENETVQAVLSTLMGLFVTITCGLLTYFLSYWQSPGREYARAFASMGVGIGGVITFVSIFNPIYRFVLSRQVSRVPFPCPYCEKNNLFEETPADDFDCEFCKRTVHFQDGKPVPVRVIQCEACKTEHKVAVNVYSYVCDRCNRPLRLRPDPRYKMAVVQSRTSTEVPDDLLQNYDVLLVAVDRRREDEIAFKIQNLLVTNLPEARRLMKTASNRTPLYVGYDLPQRKAEAVKRALQELGATATLRPTGARAPVPQKVR